MKFFFCKTTEPCVSNVVKECFLDVCVFCADWNSKMAATNMAKINIGPTGKIFSSQDLQNILKQIYTWSFTKIMVFSLIGNGHYWTILCDCLFFFAIKYCYKRHLSPPILFTPGDTYDPDVLSPFVCVFAHAQLFILVCLFVSLPSFL